MKTTLMKLRIVGIVAFLLFMISVMFGFSADTPFQFNLVQQILILVSFLIFALLILLQLWGVIAKMNQPEEELDQ